MTYYHSRTKDFTESKAYWFFAGFLTCIILLMYAEEILTFFLGDPSPNGYKKREIIEQELKKINIDLNEIEGYGVI